MTGACSGFDVRSSRPCRRHAKREIKAGCIHEHLGTHRLCLLHTDDIANGLMKCGRCLEADGHLCALVPADPASVQVSRHEVMREVLLGLPGLDAAPDAEARRAHLLDALLDSEEQTGGRNG